MKRVLPTILATLTGHSRQQVVRGRDFEWSSKLLVHNLFRIYELIFWRRVGIRAGTSVAVNNKGETIVHFHSWEDVFAQAEVFIRSLLKFRITLPVRIFTMQMASATPAPFGNPYLFAIAYDTTGGGGTPNFAGKSTTFTYTHVCTGSNLTLASGAEKNNTASDNISGFTYNSVSGTIAKNFAASTYDLAIGYLVNPSTGSNSVVWGTLTNLSDWTAASVSLTGTTATPSSPGSNTATASSGTASVAVTTTAANSWVVGYCWQVGAAAFTITGTNQTSRNTVEDFDSSFISNISTQTTTTAGSYTSSWTFTSTLWVALGLEIQLGTAAAIVHSLSSTGAGA
jgi:hypothetical protein